MCMRVCGAGRVGNRSSEVGNFEHLGESHY